MSLEIARVGELTNSPPLTNISLDTDTYNGQSAPSSVVEAISTAAEPYNSILAATASDTATGLVGAFPTTATIADTNSPVAATTRDVYSSGNP